jgi:thiol-disulfide isomerase/thioredoxin
MKINSYLVVFGIIGALILAALVSTIVFNKSISANNVSLSALPDLGPAPAIQGISGWINSQPLNLSQLRGKVVLVDFWTYSCINCIRSIPHLNAWYNEYGGNGLVIIGVHTPEFLFEHSYTNVVSAVQRFGIKYAVALDNNYSTWDAYENRYWPADYLVDKNGDIRYVTFGEGNYNQTGQVIRELLVNAGYSVPSNMTSVPIGVNFSQIGTPEIYLGYATAREAIGNAQGFAQNQTVDYRPQNISQNNTVYLSGSWYDAPDSLVAVNDSRIFLVYKADKVNVVAGGNSVISIRLDGENLSQSALGSDAHISGGRAVVNVSASRLYNVVSTPSYGWHIVEIDAGPGFRIYTFTFG